MIKLKTIKIWILALLITGCTNMCDTPHKDMNPEEVVEAYLSIAFNMDEVDQMQSLIEFTSGNLKQTLEAADAKKINEVFINKKYDLKRFSIVERRNRTPREIEITYELAYNELATESDDALVTAENTLNLIRQKGAWYITDVIGGSTTIDFQTPSVITPK
jgi:hypothetical protein